MIAYVKSKVVLMTWHYSRSQLQRACPTYVTKQPLIYHWSLRELYPNWRTQHPCWVPGLQAQKDHSMMSGSRRHQSAWAPSLMLMEVSRILCMKEPKNASLATMGSVLYGYLSSLTLGRKTLKVNADWITKSDYFVRECTNARISVQYISNVSYFMWSP